MGDEDDWIGSVVSGVDGNDWIYYPSWRRPAGRDKKEKVGINSDIWKTIGGGNVWISE